MLRRLAALTAILTIPFCVAASEQETSASALPKLVLAELPESIRAMLADAYADARRHLEEPDAVGRLGMMLQAYDQYGSADACYRIAWRLDPSSLKWSYLAGVVQAERGDYPAAITSLRRAIAIDPGYLPARLKLAESLMRVGDAGASRASYNGLLREFPELAIAHYGLGRLEAATGNANSAADHYQRAVQLAPGFGAAHYALALVERDLGHAESAQRHLQAYQRVESSRPRIPDQFLDEVRSFKGGTARDLLAEAARLANAGRLDEAIARNLDALRADPSAAQAHVNLIALYGRTASPQKAEDHYRAALALNSSVAEAHYNYGVLLAQDGRKAEAMTAFLNALSVDPFHARAHNNVAALLVEQGKLEEAAVQYRDALANDPQHRTARFNLGRVLIALGRPDEAIEQLKRILEPEDADTPLYLYALATAYVRAGDLAKANESGQRAIRTALRMGQRDVAARIDAQLQKMSAIGR